jgi:transaldolase
MSIYLDSAIPDEARQAFALGYVRGITTNPALLAKVKQPASEVLQELCSICPGPVFYQVTAPTVGGRLAEAEQVLRLNDEPGEHGEVGIKVPASTTLSQRGTRVAVTAMFSLAQAYLACEAGATYVLPYVNRTTRLRGDGIGYVRELVRVCTAVGRGTQVLAASVKSTDEAVQTLLAGAHHISMPLRLLQELGQDPLSDEAVAEFARAMRG